MRSLEPVPAAALAQNVGQAQQRSGSQYVARPIKTAPAWRGVGRQLGEQQHTDRRQGQRHHTEEYPGPVMAVDQPPLQARHERCGCDYRANGEQALQERLSAVRTSQEDQRLPRHQ
ncbi:hypothetical protein D9M71_651510 [compost metagenome]